MVQCVTLQWENNLDSMLAVLEAATSLAVCGLVTCGATGEGLPRAEVVVAGRDKAVTTTQRGEYWRLLVPGTHQLRARHTNHLGTVESDLVAVSCAPGSSARQDLVCRPRLEDSFLVTGVRRGFCRLLDNSATEREVAALFGDARVELLELCEEECRQVPDDPVSYQVTASAPCAAQC